MPKISPPVAEPNYRICEKAQKPQLLLACVIRGAHAECRGAVGFSSLGTWVRWDCGSDHHPKLKPAFKFRSCYKINSSCLHTEMLLARGAVGLCFGTSNSGIDLGGSVRLLRFGAASRITCI